MSTPLNEPWTRRLLDVGRTLMADLDESIVLERVLQIAREITGARYAALGILNDQRSELAQFVTSGFDEETRRRVGSLPRGRGVLGALIEHPQPLRLADVSRHPSSYGFPAGHPAMRSFLGVPVVIRGEAWGNLYLTEKAEGEFTEADEEAALIIAQWTAIAIENAKLYETSEQRRHELEKALGGLEATRDVAVAIGAEIALEHVLELIVKRGRALVRARSLVIMLREGEELAVHASAGHVEQARGARLPIAESTSGQVLESGRPERIDDVEARLRITPEQFGVVGALTGLLVPMIYRGEPVGILAAFDHGEEQAAFTEEDEQMLRTFAASAATAVALAQSVKADRLRSSLAAADAERRRWARELHDETLQGLGGLRLLLSSAVRQEEPARAQAAMREAIAHIEQEIENLRSIITELRPAALDELGLRSALEALLDRGAAQHDFQLQGELELQHSGRGAERLDAELESTAYRLVQEALTNVARHACAKNVRVQVREADGVLRIEVADDGVGFDTAQQNRGFGLVGMSERVGLSGGTLEIHSSGDGTVVTACIPMAAHGGSSSEGARSGAEQAVS